MSGIRFMKRAGVYRVCCGRQVLYSGRNRQAAYDAAARATRAV